MGSVIGKLEAELADVRGDIEEQQHGYEVLLNNKKRLEMEIGTYHGILDGEEDRFHPSVWVSELRKCLENISLNCALTLWAKIIHCVTLYRSLCGSAEAEGRPQPSPEQQGSTDPDGTAAFSHVKKKKSKSLDL